MPFITKDRREPARCDRLTDWQPGDLCYLEYLPLAEAWHASPRWTTADRLFGGVLLKAAYYLFTFQWADLKALLLAWQVFFIKYVMPYEDKKEAENGTI